MEKLNENTNTDNESGSTPANGIPSTYEAI